METFLKKYKSLHLSRTTKTRQRQNMKLTGATNLNTCGVEMRFVKEMNNGISWELADKKQQYN